MGLNVRPGCQSFLAAVAQKFELIAFTASDEWYAKAILSALDPHQTYFAHLVSRKHCLKRTLQMPNGKSQEMFLKDLRVLNRSEKDMLLVDNNPASYMFQVTLPISPATRFRYWTMWMPRMIKSWKGSSAIWSTCSSSLPCSKPTLIISN